MGATKNGGISETRLAPGNAVGPRGPKEGEKKELGREPPGLPQ